MMVLQLCDRAVFQPYTRISYDFLLGCLPRNKIRNKINIITTHGLFIIGIAGAVHISIGDKRQR